MSFTFGALAVNPELSKVTSSKDVFIPETDRGAGTKAREISDQQWAAAFHLLRMDRVK